MANTLKAYSAIAPGEMGFDKDLIDCTGIFAGKALNAEEGVEAAISKAGNPDVHAR